MLGKRKLGSTIGALALIGGFMGAAIGASVITASAAGAGTPAGTYNCTVTDTATGGHVTATGLTYPASVPSGAISGVSTGDPINFTCTGLGASESLAIIQAAGLAALDNPANEESYADIPHGDLGAAADGSGDLNVTSTSITTYSNGDSNVHCPNSQVAANLGAIGCLVTAADIGTEEPLVLVDLDYTNDATPVNPAISIGSQTVTPGETVTPTTTSGYWWGASEVGAGGASPLPAPTVLVDGTPSSGTDTLQVSAASYAYGSPGTPTYPALSGNITLPATLAPGFHTLTVVEGTLASGSIQASVPLYVAGASGGGTPVVPASNTGPNTGVTITGSTGWDPDSTTSWTGTWNPPGTCALPAVTAHITAVPPVPTSSTAPESFSANTSDIPTSYFTTSGCVPGAWTLTVTQSVTDPTPVASATFGPLNLVDLTSACSIASTGTCLVQQGLSQQVNGTDLTVTEYAADQGIGAPGQNPSAILVNLSTVTLGPGVFQAGQGELNTVEVNDSRGTLSGWTVTGQLEGDFQGQNVGNDHSIPADYLTWNPSVSLTYPGNIAHPGDPDWLANGVIPGGTTEPPTYGPDACASGSAATGTNGNETCPSVNDNAGNNNPSGNPATGQIGGSTAPTNHAGEPAWPSAVGSEGPSGLLYEVVAGPVANLTTSLATASDYQGPNSAVTLCSAPTGGGGGAFNCDASLSLAVPPYVAAGTYTDTLDLLTTAT